MILTNYWMLLIWMLTVGLFLKIYASKTLMTVDGKSDYKWGILSAFVLVLPYIVWSGFRTDSFGDTATYRTSFYAAADSFATLPAYAASQTKDTGYYILNSLFKIFISHSSTFFFLAIALFQMFCLVKTFRRYSTDYWMSIFLFIISCDYLSYMHNGMRQFIAVCGVFACMRWIIHKEYFKTIVAILLLSTIHQTCLMMIPIIFIVQGKPFNRKTMILIFITLTLLVGINQFMSFLGDALKDTQYGDMMTNEIMLNRTGTSIIRVIVYSVPLILSIIGKKYIDAANDSLINICVNCSIITTSLYLISAVTSGIYFGRLPIYTSLTGYILLPWLMKNMFEEKTGFLLSLMMYGLYFVYFYYQMHFAWGVL